MGISADQLELGSGIEVFGRLLRVMVSANKGVVFDGGNGLALPTPGNGLQVDGSGTLQVVIDGGTLSKSGAGVKVANDAIGEAQISSEYDQRASFLTLDDRAVSSNTGKGFVTNSGSEGLVTELAAPGMAVRVQTPGTAFNNAGAKITVPTTVSLAIAAADVTNPRQDIVVVNAGGTLAVRQGTPNVSPTDPALTPGDVVLARVFVAANDTAINTADITDLRERKPIYGVKILGKSIPSGAFATDAISLFDVGARPMSDALTGGGGTTYNLANRIQAPGWRGMGSVRVYRNGVRIKQVAGGPNGLNEYTVTDNGANSIVTFGTAPNGDALIFDYLY